MTTTTNSLPAPLTRRDRAALAHEAYARFADLVAQVPDDRWTADTDCAGWTVRDLVGHMVGAMRSAARLTELVRQQREVARRARSSDADPVDLMTELQVELTAALSVQELVAECRALVGPAARGRARTPAPARRLVRFPVLVGGVREMWRLGYLVDVVLTRDAWLHRIDLARALGMPPVLTPDHDGLVVADVVEEWGRRHRRACRLVLTGPAGGDFRLSGSAPRSTGSQPDPEAEPEVRMDAVEFCRVLSGRVRGSGLMDTAVPF